MSRFNLILIVLAVLQLVCIYFLSPAFREDSDDSSTSKTFMEFDLDEVRSIEFSDLSSKETITIRRQGDHWVLPDHDDFPVIEGKLTRPKKTEKKEGEAEDDLAFHGPGMLDKLEELEVRSPLVRLAKNHAVLNVADDKYARRMTLFDGKGEVIGRVYVARGSNGNASYIRREGSDDVYETEEFRSHEFSPSVINWSGRTLIQVDTRSIAGVSIQRQQTTNNVDVVRDAQDPMAWRITSPTQEKARRETVEVVINKLCSLAIEDIYGKKAPEDGGFDQPLATYELTLIGGGKEVITVGKKLKDGDYTAYWAPSASRGSGYYVQLSAWAIEDAIEKQYQDFLIEAEVSEDEGDKPEEEKPAEDKK